MTDNELMYVLKSATEKLDGIEAVCTANAIGCLWGWKQNRGAEDLNNAKWYIDILLKEIGAEEQVTEKAETCRERLKKEHPERVSYSTGECHGCPTDYGYAKDPEWCKDNYAVCDKCWNRPVENEEEKK